MILFFILIFFFLSISTLKFKIEIKGIHFNSKIKPKLAKNYAIKVTFKILNIIPILIIKIDNKRIQKIMQNQKIKLKIEQEKLKIIDNRNKINANMTKVLKDLKIEIEVFKLDVNIGTENAAITALIIPIISTVISIFLAKNLKQINKNESYEVNPIYSNQNFININFSGIFEIKMSHIISTIIKSNKKVAKKKFNSYAINGG